MAEQVTKFGSFLNKWRCAAILAIIAFIGAIVALIVVTVALKGDLDDLKKNTIPCPPSKGGMMTSGDPKKPSPFHDLTSAEYKRVYRFLWSDGKVNLVGAGSRISSVSIFMMDLLLPPKQEVLSFLDNQFPQPAREARVMVFKGNKNPPVVEEYRVGPLSRPRYARLIVNPKRRNPVPFSLRPIGKKEIRAWKQYLLPFVDKKVGNILVESFGGRFANCGDKCLTVYPVPVGTQLLGNITRKIWLMTAFPVEYFTLHPADFGFLINVEDTDPAKWSVEDVWYSGTFYTSLDDLATKYADDPTTKKSRRGYEDYNQNQNSMQTLRGSPVPVTPQRPPVQMEPDGKRYTIQHRHVKYMHWDFDLRLSAFTGPQVYDVRFQGNRIAYELGLSEIAVFYSGHSPMQRVNNFVNSGMLPGTQSKSLIPGVDCPEGATFLNASFFGEDMRAPKTLERAQCVFEQNTGVPLRRHQSYTRYKGSVYGGMADSVLIVRSILTVYNYDYIIDYVFHQNGAIECRAIPTGYFLSTPYLPAEAPYGFRLDFQDNGKTGNIHHHMFHFKADLDIGSKSNRYETLDISQEQVQLRQAPRTAHGQIKMQQHLHNTENQAAFNFNFDAPKHHIIHYEQWKDNGVPRAYRLHMASMSKQLLTPGENNEKSIPWARQQLAVTVQKDEELVSSSPYAMFDSLNPVTDFSTYIDGESIVDKDLVFWITMGAYHIPHKEDVPVTTTPGGHLSFFLLPYNYFQECPSVSSRDSVRVEPRSVSQNQPAEGLRVDRSGNQETRVCGALTLEQLVRDRPDDFF